MLPAARALLSALALFGFGCALAVRIAHGRDSAEARRANAAYEELETDLAKLGAGLGVGA